jgi:ketosteroid isomerase-like protein
MPTSRSVFEAYLDALNRRDLARLDELVHPDFEDRYPQSGERTRGLANLRAIVEHYPDGAWTDQGRDRVVGAADRWVTTPMHTLLRIEGSGDVYTGVQRARYPDGSDWHVILIGQMKDGRVWRVQSFWAPMFEAPAWRSAWVTVEPG